MCWCQLWKVFHCWKDGLFINLGCRCSREMLLKLALLKKKKEKKRKKKWLWFSHRTGGRKPTTTRIHCTDQDQWTHPLLGGRMCEFSRSLFIWIYQHCNDTNQVKDCNSNESLEERCNTAMTEPTAHDSHLAGSIYSTILHVACDSGSAWNTVATVSR